MSELRLHRVAVVQPYVRFLRQLGAPVDGGLRRARLSKFALESSNNFVPSESFYRFVVEMARHERLEYLGFNVGQSFGADCADPGMSRILLGSPTMLNGLEKACDITNRTISRCELGLMHSPDGTKTCFYHRPSCGPSNAASDHIAWFGIMVLLGMIRTFAGQGWRPQEIGVMASGNPGACIRKAFPDTRIRMSQPVSYLSMPRELLCTPPPGTRTVPHGDVVRVEPLGATVPDSLKLVMRSCPMDQVGIDIFAEMFRTSRRGLQRKLTAHGTSFSKLREEVRFETAREALGDENVSIDELARALGYRHPTHFSRAFRRICGMSPRRYRWLHAGERSA